MTSRTSLSTVSTPPKDLQQRDRRTGFTFGFHHVARPAFLLRFKTVRSWHHGRASTRSKPQHSAVSIAMRKRSKYAHVRPPPPLANDLAAMQFMGGGNMETHIKRVMEEQARAAGGSRGMNIGMADVYRDSSGGVWWDADEEVEYAHLLDGVDQVKAEDDAEEALWEDFEPSPQSSTSRQRPSSSRDYDGRSSIESTSSADSDLDLKYLIPPPEVDSYPTFTSGYLNDPVLASSKVCGRGMNPPLLLPPRSSRQAAHLLRSVSLADLQAFGKPEPGYPSASSSTQISSDRGTPGEARAKGGFRRRVPPLKVNSSLGSSSNLQSRSVSAPISAAHLGIIDGIRKQFIEDSFAPPPSMSTPSTLPTRKSRTADSAFLISSKNPSNGPKTNSSSTFNIRALFRKRSH